MQGSTGVTATTSNHFVLDVGRIYIGIDVAALEASTPEVDSTNWLDAIADATFLGGTRNGATFDLNRTLREMPVDGLRGPTKGFVRSGRIAPTLQVNLVEHTVKNYENAIAGLVSTAVGETGSQYTKITSGPILAASYLSNIAIAATYTDPTAFAEDRPIIILLTNVMAHSAPTFTFSDEDEVLIPVTFNAHIDPANPNTPPWAIYHPTYVAPD